MKLLRASLALTLAVGTLASLPLRPGHALAAGPRVTGGGQSPTTTTATFLRTTSPISLTTTSVSAQARTQSSGDAAATDLGPQKPEGDKPVTANAPGQLSGLSAPSVTASTLVMPASSASRVAPDAATAGLVNGFDGLSHRDQRLADGGNQFSTEPPDQALCVGGGFVLESVNTALQVYNKNGTAASGVTSLNQFFTGRSSFVRPTGPFGDSIGDPRCFYDSASRHFFVSVYDQTANPATGSGFGTLPTNLLVAVSQTSDPRGSYNVYAINTTLDGTNCSADRPCFPDYPQIGADANGFYIDTNAFFFGNTVDVTQTFEGAQLYAFPKTLLEAGGATVPGALFARGVTQTPQGSVQEDGAFTIQPAQPAPGQASDTSNGGSMYYLSSLDTSGMGDNRLAIWALSNTSALATDPLATSLRKTIFTSETYATPTTGAQQRDDNIRPVGTGKYPSTSTGVKPTPQSAPRLDTGDDRMQQVTYAAGMLWAGLNTALTVTRGSTTSNQTGVAYFILTPSAPGGAPAATVVNQGLLGFQGIDAFYPSIGVNSATGAGAMTFALSGLDIYPSPAYIPIDASGLASAATAPVLGNSSDDGFTGYKPYSNGTGRWGDYSQAATDSNGSVWLAQEYIAATPCDPTANPNSTGCLMRTVLANWGTRITNVTPVTNLPLPGAATPELSSGELLGTGLLVLSGLVIVRRRRARRGAPGQDDPTD